MTQKKQLSKKPQTPKEPKVRVNQARKPDKGGSQPKTSGSKKQSK